MSELDENPVQPASRNSAPFSSEPRAVRSVCVVGLGYIGLPTAAVLASRGIRVYGCDVNNKVVDTINRGEIHIVEPELDVAVHAAVNSGFLQASTAPHPADVFVIAVPTPFKNEHKPDLSYIQTAVEAVAPVLQPDNLVILESTSPVGTTEQLAQWLAEKRPDLSFPQQAGESTQVHVAHCPERVLPGNVLRELVDNDRVIGGMTPECSRKACKFYAEFVRGELVQTDVRIAELCKLSENAFRDVNIAFANELSLLCDRYGIDVWELIEVANRHPRVDILQPGAGVGGHCIAVDPWFIISYAPDLARLMRAARDVNDYKPQYICQQITKAAKEFENPVVAFLGLAFKPDVDDLRESPALGIVRKFAEDSKILVMAIEPHIDNLPASLEKLPNVSLTTIEDVCNQANIVVSLVRHQVFVADPLLANIQAKKVDFVRLWN